MRETMNKTVYLVVSDEDPGITFQTDDEETARAWDSSRNHVYEIDVSVEVDQ
jgi:hypothetical protein